MERGHVHAWECMGQVQVMSERRWRWGGRDISLFPWDYINLGFKKTRSFFKLANGLPKLL